MATKKPTVKTTTIYSAAEFSAAMELTQQRIRQYVQQGMPRESHGRFDLIACAKWFQTIAHQRQQQASALTAGSDLRGQTFRLTKLRADREEIALQRDVGAVIPFLLALETWKSIILRSRVKLLAIPGRMPKSLEGEPFDKFRTWIDDAIRGALAEVAEDEEPLAAATQFTQGGNK